MVRSKELTVPDLKSLRPKDIGERVKDKYSLYGVVKAKGDGVSVLFRWRYRFNGMHKDFTCGTWPNKSLSEIRKVCDGARFAVSQGKDPNEERRIERLQEKAKQAEAIAEAKTRIAQAEAMQARMTVNDLFDRWAKVELIRRKDGGKEIQRMFKKDVLPLIGELAVEDIRKGHVTEITDVLLARGVTRMAKLIFSLVRQMFRYAVDRDIIENEPTASIRKARIGGTPTERDRILSEDEIRALHKQISSARLLASTEAAIWLALSTCCRIGELLSAEWKHVRLDAREWFIPAENSKNGKPHTVYLSDFSLHQFEILRSISGASRWCFPNRRNTGHVCEKTVTKQIGDRQRGDGSRMSRRSSCTGALILRGGKWTPHDLRRTGETMMIALRVIPEVADRCLNHTEQNRVRRIYQRYNYDNEKRDAWRVLGERLELLLRDDASNVIPFHQTA